ncbi:MULTISPECIES: hypothetical protein [unclassified Pseudomonas]|uniref:hypothetical protein n=1 Tax=unclassified Pseudomonas TaxID=196821 RepID=UPI00224AB14C|nr:MULTISPECIES: hypothetical protein [unclassified Pseudomonas]MCX2891032.1 hypothetical protein [Pseudomonas sp. DCB_BI]MDH4550632.1 hypothetical protein [Pseudomonas sp. BN607]
MQTSIKLVTLALPVLLSIPHAVYAEENTGSILFLDKDNGQCVIAAPGEGTGKRIQNEFHHTDGYSECKGFAARKMSLDGLSSAVQILITGDSNCSKEPAPGKWWMELRTTRRFTSTEWFELDDLASRENGKIITPGLIMVDKKVEPSSAARDSTACVRVIAGRAAGSAPKDTETAKPNKIFVYENIDPVGVFTCNADQIIWARGHEGDENDKKTTYKCATYKHGSTELSISDNEWTPWIHEHYDEWFMCPEDTVMTGREHEDDEEGKTRYRCGKLMKGTQQMSIHKFTEWSGDTDEPDHFYYCDLERFMVGRWHKGDENKPTRYRCATAWMQGAE